MASLCDFVALMANDVRAGFQVFVGRLGIWGSVCSTLCAHVCPPPQSTLPHTVTRVRVRGQLSGVSFLLPRCGFWDLTELGSLACRHLAAPSPQLLAHLFDCLVTLLSCAFLVPL